MIEQLRDKPLYALSVGEFTELVNSLFAMQQLAPPEASELPKYVNMKGAANITSKTENALRVQISQGKLQSIKKGNRHYFERSYLEQWLSGSVKNGGAKNA